MVPIHNLGLLASSTLYNSQEGGNSIKEDKDQDFCFNDPFFIDLIDPPKVPDLVFIPLIDRTDSPKVSDPALVPSSELESSIEPTVENQMVGKVYSRKKVIVLQLIEVQESESISGNELKDASP
ncbi:hypothetical protein CK203_084549 [Vitis vinifera]|uniref:Uncharacterized protein n=1 Tax=Vitis vinifera TaxID=29760 RepID=A0A438DNQ1_VITVI|nr:hypothetical protein CK203_084549 [Vitis vinifera]